MRTFHQKLLLNGKVDSIQKKVFVLIMAAVVSCTVALGAVFAVEANQILLEREFMLIERSLSSTVSNIDHLLENANYVYDLVSSDGNLQSYLSEWFKDQNSRFAAELDVTAVLNAYKMYNSTLESVSLFGLNGLHSNSQSYSFVPSIDAEAFWMVELEKNLSPQWFVSDENRILISVNEKPYMTLGGPVRNLANGDLLGLLFLDVSARRLEECVNHPFESATVLVDREGRQILTVNHERAHVYQDIPDAGQTEVVVYDLEKLESANPVKVQEGYLFAAQLNNGWYVVDIVPNVLSNSGIMMLLGVMLLSMILIMLLAYHFSQKLAIDITQRLVKMTHDMEQVEQGDFSVVMDTDGNDEITILAKRFNSLLKYINVLINTLYAKQEELAEAELKTLQAQIKPHFLYNTLDTVVWLARFQRTKDIETIVLALTTYFRLGLNAGEDIIPLSKEIEHMKSYLTIQMYRYYQIFTYDIEIEDSLKAELGVLRVPKLTLQPLVENAIYHGIKEIQKTGHLVVSIKRKAGDILISVSDNGKGMDKEMLDRLNHIRESSQKGYGLKNVDNRIRKLDRKSVV